MNKVLIFADNDGVEDWYTLNFIDSNNWTRYSVSVNISLHDPKLYEAIEDWVKHGILAKAKALTEKKGKK